MEEIDKIQRLIDEISFRRSDSKNYQKMNVEEIGKELRDVIKFEEESFKKIEEFEKTQQNSDLAKYAKMICKNKTQREITQIQEIYLKKIDEKYLNSK